MGWYTISGRQVGWAAGLLLSQPPEHFIFPDYPVEVSWFSVIPFLQNIRLQFPAGINPLTLIGYRHIAGTTETVVPSVSFTLDFFVQQGEPLSFVDALINNALWEKWDETEGRPVPQLPLPFTFVFTVRQAPSSEVLRQFACPYAYISRLRGYIDGDSRALKLQVDFTAPLIQFSQINSIAVVSNYDPDMPFPLIREIVTEDWGTRQVVDLSWEVTNQIEFVYSSWRDGQPLQYIRTANRIVYQGSQIQVNLQVLHPYFSSNEFARDWSMSPFDFQFIIAYRYDNPNFEKRLLKFFGGRVTSMETTFSFDMPITEQVQLTARYMKWEEVT